MSWVDRTIFATLAIGLIFFSITHLSNSRELSAQYDIMSAILSEVEARCSVQGDVYVSTSGAEYAGELYGAIEYGRLSCH